MAVRRNAHKALWALEHGVADELNKDAWPDEDLPAHDDVALTLFRGSSDVVDAPNHNRVGRRFDRHEDRRSLYADRSAGALERRGNRLREVRQHEPHEGTVAEWRSRPALFRRASRDLSAR